MVEILLPRSFSAEWLITTVKSKCDKRGWSLANVEVTFEQSGGTTHQHLYLEHYPKGIPKRPEPNPVLDRYFNPNWR